MAIPDAAAAHVVGQGGKGLKQISDISGARISAYVLAKGSRKERHVSIRGTASVIPGIAMEPYKALYSTVAPYHGSLAI